ncbi:type III glutamate--ammonia ligase [Chitinimonas viridis]|uniref:Type III glutamate--ammonia ligase n=1 Tax=Chitinimonas viridis TaxID=664880 RepID=A0ABT8B795_9NEIS|nr:type III glutamate--ammonia ligase [Chitinimonas viridis]MDN3578138.1 type III glutamate--ammonia ligase [Chitinimonas viridis]
MAKDESKQAALAQAQQWLQQHQVKYLLAQFVDIHGAAKTKVVPARHLDMITHTGAGFSGYAIWGTGIARNGGDYYARADLDTLALVPWQPGYARVVGDGHVHGQPHPLCSRVLLKQQLARLAVRGWTLNTGLEPEFILLRRTADGDYRPADELDVLDKASYDYKGLSREANRVFLERVTEAMAAVGADVYQIDHEDAPGQYEINYVYSDALTSADRYIYFKMAASHAAEQLGMLCSFMPKPFADRAGSGLHFHLSIADATGRNLFEDTSDPQGYGLSSLGYHFLAGILQHAPALTAICAPTVNSYKRLVVGNSLSGATWAPAYVAYGDNRTVLARCPGGRIEWRLADAGANPYLVTAALIAAGLDGISRQLQPGRKVDDDLYEYDEGQLERAGIRPVPQNLGEAVAALEADQVMLEALGADFVAEFARIKRMEWVEYSRHVSDWERKRYADFF